MDLLLVQSAGQLGDALLIELVQAIVQPDRAIAELACAIIQGGHAVIQGLGAIGQLGGTVLCGVGTVSGGGNTVGVLVDTGHEILDLRQAVLQGTDICDILAVLSLILQLVMHGLLGAGSAQIKHGAEHGGIVALHQPQSSFQVVVGLGCGEIQGNVQLAVLEAGLLLPDGAHHLLAGSGQCLFVHGQHFVNDGSVVVPGHGGVDQAALHQGAVGGGQNTIGHLLGTGLQGGVIGAQGIQAVGQLAQTIIQGRSTAVQLRSTVQQGQGTVGQLGSTVHQLGGTIHQLVHGIVQLADAIGQLVEAAQVKGIGAQRIGVGGTGQHDLRCGQVLNIGFHSDAVLQIILHSGQVIGQQTVQRILHTGQADESGHAALGGRFQHSVLGAQVGGILTKDHAHSSDERGDNGTLLAVDGHGAGLVVGQVNGHGQVAALADQVLKAVGHAVQRIGDICGDGQGLVGIALIVHVGVVGVPDQLFAVLGERGIALGVLDIGQSALIGDIGQAGSAVQVLADGGGLDGAVGVHHGVDGLVLGIIGLGGCKGGQGHACGESQRQRRTGETKRFFHGNYSLSDFLALEDSGTSQCMVVWRMTQSSSIRAAGRTTRMTAILISAPREMSRQMLCSSSILLMAATPTVAAKKVRPLVRMDWLQCSSDCWAASRGVRP